MTVPLLWIKDVTKRFAGVRALSSVSLEVRPGEVHALVGENGAGKSTLIKVITGALLPDTGTIEIQGRPVPHLTPTRARELGVACVYQHPALFPDLTVGENIALRLEISAPLTRVQWRADHERAAALLRNIGAEFSPRALIRDLSMPEKQLVEIACAVGANARVVLLDEPTASLTQREQHVLFEFVRTLRRQNSGIIYVSHRLDEVFALADRVTVLRDGQRVFTGASAELNESALIQWMVGRDLSPRRTERKPMTPQPILSVTDLTCQNAGVRSVTFGIGAGEIFGLAGLVGAGRTELARTLFGLTPADAGEIVLAGQKVSITSPAGAVTLGIAYVPEDRARHGVILDLSLEQNISLAAHKRLFPYGWLRTKLERAVARDYIRKLDIRPPNSRLQVSALSGGNQQKVALARWLATQPKLLILDEPTQGVDVGAKQQIHDLISRLAREGLAVLLISSDLPELLALSHRIGVMRAGRLVTILPGNSEPHTIMAAAFGQEREAA